MEKITDFSTIQALVTAHFKPGVITNGSLAGPELRREASRGSLYISRQGGSLLVFRQRDGYFRMTYYLGSESVPELPDCPVVTEVAYREKDREKAEKTVERFGKAGFELLFERCRRTRESSAAEWPLSADTAKPHETREVLRLMEENFHHMAGCIPTPAEMCEDIAAGKLLCTRNARGSITGIMHFEAGRASSEIRHLAVRKEYRREGIAQKLFESYIIKTRGKKSRVWATAGNSPAERFYERNGYKLDGYRSFVLKYSGKDK